jgi:hypothetical protein
VVHGELSFLAGVDVGEAGDRGTWGIVARRFFGGKWFRRLGIDFVGASENCVAEEHSDQVRQGAAVFPGEDAEVVGLI